ncbi:MAG: hypothetical protein A2855_00880 [Candidatus Liptonbacteria bacterium RIFCSPHIGHO2_01_FULL_57_28]|uniref:DUF218 domain-containing protein n=1 Tax=Candidatus Liptonbacteria bacterium RIFCSPHIGHO2_01_FULL_57_28 TaxID=1798647 RepID=A0A1G2CAY9_9BACT|nr:MAG: hypothetical protein A2855_00880 [Candidatus Liptonbacteria bacterium RIFCSPHIGHO2_01_FULL_57_28]
MNTEKLEVEATKTLLRRIFYGTVPEQIDALYLFGQTTDNQESEFRVARDLVHRVGAMVVPDGPAECGYPGGEVFAAEVQNFFPGEVVRMPLVGDRITNTRSEARGLIALSLERGWRNVGLLSTRFHQLRAVMTVISAAVREDREGKVRFWSIPGVALPWYEKVIHSQGILRATRFELIGHELERILKYDDILPPEHILAWMDNR